MKKIRLDQLLHEQYPQYSRRQIQSWIMQGRVTTDGKLLDKPGMQVDPHISIQVNIEVPKYVSRAGFKLEKALEEFRLDVRGLTVLDAGLSTGGFTDCLLQHGAHKVIGVDVGYGQVHEKIRQNERVVVIERTNIKEISLDMIGGSVDMVTLDLSFISLLKVISAIDIVLKSGGYLLVLIKPQFEARKEQVGRGGIIKDPHIHEEVVQRVTQGIASYNYDICGIIPSPILGSEGNKEFLALFKKR